MTVIFRPHRGSLDDSMKVAKEFNNMDEMKRHIVQQYNNLLSIENIVISDKVTNDERIGWEDARLVCVDRLGNEDYLEQYGCPQAIGMCATIYPKQKVVNTGINWIKFDRNNIPPQRKPYLKTDGKRVDVCYWPSDEWGMFEGIRKVSDVTHYAEIDLPNSSI